MCLKISLFIDNLLLLRMVPPVKKRTGRGVRSGNVDVLEKSSSELRNCYDLVPTASSESTKKNINLAKKVIYKYAKQKGRKDPVQSFNSKLNLCSKSSCRLLQVWNCRSSKERHDRSSSSGSQTRLPRARSYLDMVGRSAHTASIWKLFD